MKLTTFFTVKKTKTETKSKSDFRSTSKINIKSHRRVFQIWLMLPVDLHENETTQ